MMQIEQLFERAKLRRCSTMKYPNEKPGFLKRAREKAAALLERTHSRTTSIDSCIPGMRVHLAYSSSISQPLGDE